VSRARAERRGRVAEWIAMLFLIAKGYRILGHRLRTPYGEVDIAAWKSGILVIAEVKARATFDAGAYALGPQGQSRIARAAQTLAGRWRLTAAPMRFDLIVVGAGLLPRHERGAWFDERSHAYR
jgi:putative endonuclease